MPRGVESRAARATLSAADVRTDDWPAQATDAIVNVVGIAHDKIRVVRTIAKAIVWGLFAGVLGAVAAVLFTIGILRVLDVYLPSSVVGDQHMWAAYVLVGLVFAIAGLALLRAARHAPADDEA
jgi:hypothetical protein